MACGGQVVFLGGNGRSEIPEIQLMGTYLERDTHVVFSFLFVMVLFLQGAGKG